MFHFSTTPSLGTSPGLTRLFQRAANRDRVAKHNVALNKATSRQASEGRRPVAKIKDLIER
jgi:hypothetical protein